MSRFPTFYSGCYPSLHKLDAYAHISYARFDAMLPASEYLARIVLPSKLSAASRNQNARRPRHPRPGIRIGTSPLLLDAKRRCATGPCAL